MFTLTLVLVALFVIVAAIAKNKDFTTAVRHGFHVNTFVVGSYPQIWWEDCRKVTALLHGERVTIKGRSYGTTSTGNFLFIDAQSGVCYTLYGHHLTVESVWN
jgi:hypothetical protein